MKSRWMAACAALAVPVAAALAGGTVDAPRDAARAAVKALGEGLKAQLMAAIKAGGPVAAIPVCNTAAPAIGAEVAKAHGLSVRRTALKVRNPANEPDDWERRVLEDFAAKISAGTDPATLEHFETITTDGISAFRYMKAIPMAAEPCLACHGTDMTPEVRAEVAKLYPADQATGFRAGELRGAFSVTKVLEK